MSGAIMRHTVLVFLNMHREYCRVYYPDQQMHTVYVYVYIYIYICGIYILYNQITTYITDFGLVIQQS